MVLIKLGVWLCDTLASNGNGLYFPVWKGSEFKEELVGAEFILKAMVLPQENRIE